MPSVTNGLGDAIEHLDVFGLLCFEWLQNGFGDKIDGVNKASGLIGGTCRERSLRHLGFQLSRKQVLVNLP